jgi:hypothetical protein
MNTKHILAIAVAGLLLGVSGAASAADCALVANNLIQNCGFESSPTDFTGWTLSGTDTTYPQGAQYYGIEQQDPFPVATGGTAPDGGQNQAFVSDPYNPLTLSQTVATTAGASYTVSFAVAQYDVNEPEDTSFVNSLAANFGGSALVTLTNSADFAYTTYSFDVAATSASSTFSLAMTDLTGEWLIDDVAVTADVAAVPETSTTVLMSAGLLALGLAARRKRQ